MSSSVPIFYKKCNCTDGCYLCDGYKWVNLQNAQARVRCSCGYYSLDCNLCNGFKWIKTDMYRVLFSGSPSNKILIRCTGTCSKYGRCDNCTLTPCGNCYDAISCNVCDRNGWYEPSTVGIGISFMGEWTETTYEDLLDSFARIISESSATTE